MGNVRIIALEQRVTTAMHLQLRMELLSSNREFVGD